MDGGAHSGGNRPALWVVQPSATPEQRFRELFELAYAPVVAYARRRTTPADADDVVAEVFAIAWRRRDDLPPGNPLPWLYGVARRVLANQRRSTSRRLRLVARLAEQPRTPPAGDEDGRVIEALESLRPADQEILRLAAWEGLTSTEIAVALGCTANAAALRLSRARARLRAAMTDMAVSRTQGERRRSAGA